MILITGAAGKTGQAVIQELVQQGQRVRALVHRQEQAILLEHQGVEQSITGDLLDPVIMGHAVMGVKTVYHICPNMHPEEELIGEIAIRAAQTSGAKHFVYHSVLHPQIEAMPHHWQKLLVEEKLLESGLNFTILQPAAYMQNVLGNWDQIVSDGIYSVPYAVGTRLNMVDLRDVAEVASKVLLEDGHEGAVYELSGPQVLSQSEAAAIMAEQLGRDVRAETVSTAQWRQEVTTAGLSLYAVETLVSMFLHYEQYDFWGNPRVLGWLLGRQPTSFAQFIERTMHNRQDA